jgi:hypothetical protein
MMLKRVGIAFVLAALLGAPAVLWAQERSEPLPAFALTTRPRVPVLNGSWRPLRVAKWTTLVAGTASAGYGFSANRDADERYVEIERICQVTPARCTGGATGPYADPVLEAMYQDVRALDKRSRMALIAGQVSLISSVVLFILDLRTGSAPPNVPYDPDRLRIVHGPGTIGVHVRTR